MARKSDESPKRQETADKEYKEAIRLADRIIGRIEEDVPSGALRRAEDFFESVRTGVEDVKETITENGRVTGAQKRALENWAEAVGKFIPD